MPASGGGNPLVGQFYPDVAVAEDVSEIIYQITPEDTPVYNSCGDGSAQSPFHLWLTRSILGRSHNAQHEGFTYTFTGQMNYADPRRFNTTQIFNALVRVSESEVASRHYAIDDAFADEMSQAMTKVKLDAEHTILRGTLASGATGTARKLQGILEALISGITTYSAGAGATLSESLFNDGIQGVWSNGGEPRDVYTHGYMKRKVSNIFTGGGALKQIAAENQRLVATVSTYISDFFPVNIYLSRDMPKNLDSGQLTGYGILAMDRTMVKKMWLRPWVAERAPKTADAYDGVVKGEFTLEYGTPLAHAYWANYN